MCTFGRNELDRRGGDWRAHAASVMFTLGGNELDRGGSDRRGAQPRSVMLTLGGNDLDLPSAAIANACKELS